MTILARVLTLSLLAPAIAIAGSEQNSAASADTVQKTLQPLSYGNALSVIGSLLLVLALLFAAAWIMRRGQSLMRPRSGQIQIVSQLALGVKDKVLLLKIGEENILVGCSTGNIRALHTWQGELPEGSHEAAATGDNFLTLLQQQLRKPKGEGNP